MSNYENYDSLGEELTVIQELIITSESLDPAEVLHELENARNSNWVRSVDEEKSRISSEDYDDYRMFTGTFSDPDASVVVFLHYDNDKRHWRVSNIVWPAKNYSMTHEQYNTYLQDFRDFIVVQASERGVKAELTPESGTRPISYWVGESAAVHLKKFATVVPKSSPTMHSSDQHLWFSFLKSACPLKGNDPISNLERWLTEVAHFPERVSQKLAINAEEHNSYKLFDDQG